jgi:hypothetical protein
MRWLILSMTMIAMLLCCTRHGAGAMGFWLFVSVVGTLATGLAFAQAKISRNARSETLSAYDLKRLRGGKNPLGFD